MNQRVINGAATRIKRRILLLSPKGRLPQSERAWLAMCNHLGLGIKPTMIAGFAFTARLWYSEVYGGYVAMYNGRHSKRRRLMYIAHELAEYLAITEGEYRTLFDETEVFGYEDYPGDVRHRIAERFVYLCFR